MWHNKIKSFFSEDFFKNPIIVSLFLTSLALNIVSFISLAIWLKPTEYPIILHYNVYFGVDLIGNWKQAYMTPAMGFFFIGINSFLAYHFFKRKERIASYVLLIAAFLIQLSILIVSSSIILINY